MSHVTDVVDLVQSAYRGEASRAGWTTEADLLDGTRIDALAVRALVSAPRSVVLLAYPTGAYEPQGRMDHPGADPADATDELLACCHLKDEGGGSGYLGMLAVRPNRQGGGIGRLVMIEGERRVASDWQCRQLRMIVIRQRAELLSWYQRLGFALTGETRPFPYGNDRFGKPKRSDLEFVELVKTLARP